METVQITDPMNSKGKIDVPCLVLHEENGVYDVFIIDRARKQTRFAQAENVDGKLTEKEKAG